MQAHRQEAPQIISSHAERCVVHVKNRFGLELDYTSDTMSVLDHFVAQVVSEECEGITPPPGDKRRSHLVHLMAPTLGAYYGEVLRLEHRARWRFTDLDPDRWVLEFEDFFLRFNPAGAAAEAIMAEPIEDWRGAIATAPSLMVHLHERLAAAPPIPEDEFFTFAARHEVIQIASDYLRERASRDGEVGCAPEDYDRYLPD